MQQDKQQTGKMPLSREITLYSGSHIKAEEVMPGLTRVAKKTNKEKRGKSHPSSQKQPNRSVNEALPAKGSRRGWGGSEQQKGRRGERLQSQKKRKCPLRGGTIGQSRWAGKTQRLVTFVVYVKVATPPPGKKHQITNVGATGADGRRASNNQV